VVCCYLFDEILSNGGKNLMSFETFNCQNLKTNLKKYCYCQIWLNRLMNDCHLNNTTKLKKKNISVAYAIGPSVSMIMQLFQV
jgi:hypothetical protein